ncbi:MAG: DNA alkylation repair protein [SAR324 cluster bacterium]|nr:DNA alkylation repair protein [SAR324 cluster bacterium]
MLRKYLPDHFPQAVDILIRSLGPELSDPGKTDWDAFIVLAECAFVADYGKGHYDVSMQALYEMTKRFSAEGDLRTFLEVDYEKTMSILHAWCNDSSPHVRRLVSEGTRPRLPLAGRITRFQKNPAPVLELLEKLKDDPELYVRRSVANNINDIAKDNPDIAIETLRKWQKSGSKNVQWIVRHASRSLLKQGNTDVLEILGYSPDVRIEVSPIKLNQRQFKVGDTVELSFSIHSQEKKSRKLMIDYVVNYMKSNGKGADKVFKMRDIQIAPDATLHIEKSHRLKNTSGRKHYSGEHSISLQINGKRYPKSSFSI